MFRQTHAAYLANSAMPKINLPGVKIYNSKGRLYAYHRVTGIRLESPIGTAEFIAELARAEAKAKRVGERSGTWGGLVKAYKESPRYLIDLKPRTRSDYDKVLFWLKPLEQSELTDWDRGYVTEIQDRARAKHGLRFAKYVTAVISLVFKWGMGRNLAHMNPAEGVEKIRRPKDSPRANRPWRDEEWTVVWTKASKHLKPILALAGILGWRGGETITAPRNCYDPKTKTISRISSKSGRIVTSTVPAMVAVALNAIFPHNATTLLVNSRGKPWTQNGFRVSVFKLIRKLEQKGLVGKGLTIHGLRHTVATRARELGFDPRAIADVLGQETEGMALHYSKTADSTKRTSNIVTMLAKNRKRTRSV